LPKTIFTSTDISEISVFKPFVGWTWDKLFKTSFIKDNNLKFQELPRSNDLLFTMLAVALAKKMQYINQILVHYRDNSDNSLSKTRSKSSYTIFLVLDNLKTNLQQLGLYNNLKADYRGLASHLLVADFYRLNETALPDYLKDLKDKWLEVFDLCNLSEKDFKFYDDFHRYQMITTAVLA
jgi:hypothetical protein